MKTQKELGNELDKILRENNQGEVPMEKTEEIVRNEFLDNVWDMVDYWENESRRTTTRDKLEGLAFSILAMIDGSNINIPGFILAPCPHEEDKEFRQNISADWYPYNNSDNIKCDIGGCLHELFYSRKPERGDDI